MQYAVNKAMKNTCIALAIALAFTATSSAASKPEAADNQTQQFVDARMHQTMSSIEKSLSTLVSMTRGGEAPPKSGPIGHTAMGASGPNAKPVQPDVIPAPHADPGPGLEKKIDIQWNGSPDQLLADIAGQIGYSYTKSSKSVPVRIRMSANKVSVREALAAIAKQLDGRADILVSVDKKSIALVSR